MTQLSATGLYRSRLDERLAQLKEEVRAVFGQDINLDADTTDGQTLGIFAEAISNLDQLIEDVYHSFNPSSATGAALSRLVQLNGIRRIGGSYSTCDVLCVGQDGTIIPAGSLIKSASTNATFASTTEVAIDSSGQALVPCRAVAIGAVLAPAATLTKIDTPIYGWQSASNPSDAIVGRDEESDEQLRVRRKLSTATPAQSILEGVYGALANLPQVRQAKVYENDQDTVQPVTGLPPHSMYCVVEGGLLQDIANMIWLKKTAGTTLVGRVTQTVTDSMGSAHTMRFSRPSDTLVHVSLVVSPRSGWPPDGAQRIKTALCAWAASHQEIGGEVIQSRLFDALNTVPAHSVTSLSIGTAAGPSSPANIAVPFDGLARFDPGRISVVVT